MNITTQIAEKVNPAIALSVILALSTISPVALADVQINERQQSDWRVMAGFGAYVFPEFDGAKDHRVLALPLLDITYKDRVYFNFFEGLGVKIIDTKAFTLKGGISYAFGREEDDHALFAGTEDIDNAAKLTLAAKYKIEGITSFVKVSKYLGATDGLQAEFGVQTRLLLGDKRSDPMLQLNVSVQYSNEDYMMGYFGIDSQQSFDSGLDGYTAEAGFSSVSAGATYIHPFSKRWATTVNLKYARMLGDAVDSPLVLEQNQISGGLFVTYTF